MSRFIETIQLKDGQFYHLSLHQARVNRSWQAHFTGALTIDLRAILPLANEYPQGLFKCRVTYDQTLENVEVFPYAIRPIHSLQLVESQLDYTFKYKDRKTLQTLFSQRGTCDDVLIVKNGQITDASYTNVAFFDGKNWWTPNTPLLRGVQREALLQRGIILEKSIPVTSIYDYSKIKLFNAMMDWKMGPTLPTSAIMKNW
ncbi:MAG: aminotransferase class IV family protein [Bacteroidota bacterium]